MPIVWHLVCCTVLYGIGRFSFLTWNIEGWCQVYFVTAFLSSHASQGRDRETETVKNDERKSGKRQAGVCILSLARSQRWNCAPLSRKKSHFTRFSFLFLLSLPYLDRRLSCLPASNLTPQIVPTPSSFSALKIHLILPSSLPLSFFCPPQAAIPSKDTRKKEEDTVTQRIFQAIMKYDRHMLIFGQTRQLPWEFWVRAFKRDMRKHFLSSYPLYYI